MSDPAFEPAPGAGAGVESLIGPLLVARLHGLLRSVRLYDPSNQAIQDQLRDLLRLVEHAGEDELVLVAMGQCFYVNGVRVRAEGAQAAYFDALTKEFEQRGLGGLRFLEGLGAEELAGFLRLMVEHADPAHAADFGGALAAAGVVHVVPVSPGELGSMAAEAAAAAEEAPGRSERERAVRTHRQAVAGTRGAVLQTARTGKPAMRRIKRVVQPIVDSIMTNELSIVGLTALKNHEEYTYAHCVNVSILSVAIGHYLGLARPALANLGVAALLHDIGKLTIPPEVLRKPDRLSEEEWTLMQRHPIEGLKTVSRAPGLSALTLDMLYVAFQHHLTYDGRGYPAISRPWKLSAVSRLVTPADCFDAMTAHRAYRRRPFTGYEALRLMLGPDRRRYDPAALWALVRTVGLYPAGTLLLTRSGHLVVSMSPNPEDARRPHCRVLRRPDGTTPPDVDPEIWSPMAPGIEVSRIVNPEEFEGEVDRLLAA